MVKTGKPQLLIFDVNQTLLDLNPLSTAVNQAIGDREAIDKWFNSLLHYSFVETVTTVFNELEKNGVISYSRNRILVKDIERL